MNNTLLRSLDVGRAKLVAEVPKTSTGSLGAAPALSHLQQLEAESIHIIREEHHFDSDRKHDALHSSHDRLAAPISEPEDIDIAFLQIPFFRLGAEELRHIQSGGKVASLCADYPDPEGVVVV